jgi:glycosyltransferase involved in cell wall biosynthesis
MHVLFVIDSLMIGGSELAALRLFRVLRGSAQISLIHFHRDGPLLDEYRSDGAVMHHIALHSFTSTRNIAAILKLRSLIDRLRPDVIHTHDAYSNMVVLAGLFPSFRYPWITSRRWLDQYVRPSHERLNRIAFSRSSAIAVNSESIAKFMMSSEGIASEKIVVIPNFVDVPSNVELINDQQSEREVTIGMVSRLTHVKRHDLAISAVAHLIGAGLKVQLIIVGEGESRADIERCVTERGMRSHVLLVGERRGGARLYLDFDIALSTSDSEGSPNSVLEAMAAGCPVVATDVGGTRDVCRHGVDGLLIKAGDVDAIATGLRRLVLSPELRSEMGNAGRIRASEAFSPMAVARKTIALYERISVGGRVSLPCKDTVES